MKLLIPLQRSFVRTRFAYTRQRLLGRVLPQSTSVTSKKSEVKSSTNKPKVSLINTKSPLDIFKKLKRPSLRQFLFSLFMLGSVVLLAILFVPMVYYTLFPADPVPIKASSEGTPLGGSFDQNNNRVETRRIPEPPYDPTLPDGQWLLIPRIGVQSEIIETANSEEALAKGIWRVQDFGVAGDLTKPMILAAHRFGYKWWWESNYWKYHSFYLLPKLEPGDFVEVIANHRKYLYEIYAGEEGEEITDYNADLILYTCKFLNSPLRHFRYARLLDPTKDTQAKNAQATPQPAEPTSTPEAGESAKLETTP